MSLLVTSTESFGILEPLHRYALDHASPITRDNWWKLFIVPLIPLYLQAVLLRRGETRKWRIPLGLLGISLLWEAGLSYRFVQPWLNGFNNGTGIGILHLTARYLEFAFLEGPVYDRYYEEKKSRYWFIAALDVSVNARWIGLGAVDLDHGGKMENSDGSSRINGHAKNPNGDSSNGHANGGMDDIPDGGVEVGGKIIPNLVTKSSWLPLPNVPRTRLGAVVRHCYIAIRNYIVVDTTLSLLREFGHDTIGSTTATPDALHRFAHNNLFLVFPHANFGHGLFAAPPWLVEIWAVTGVAACVWLGISMGYHFFGALCVGSGLWETESWEIDLFDSPLHSDSLLDFWGRRWHQFFRHHFILFSTLILGALHLPITSPLILATSFVLSGLMHAYGQFLMDPVPSLIPIATFFFISGVGCASEVLFKRVTGRKVHGLSGRIWTWTFMLSAGKVVASAWMESGLGGSLLTPPWAGDIVKGYVTEWVVQIVPGGCS
ncbi:hypothetical protein IAR55_002284 [Kwoniella newhampshirensis]|uniref:Wax synthase domain-containing protein n=1 Tax=Kwoniella newhampshirensis TaxID=1651941 RepID=A0AAW0YT79_9TREE